MSVASNIINYLKGIPAITTIVGNRIYEDWYPDVKSFPFILVIEKDGEYEDEDFNLRNITIETRCYTLNDKDKADYMDSLILSALKTGNFDSDFIPMSGQTLNDTDKPEWVYYLSEYETQAIGV